MSSTRTTFARKTSAASSSPARWCSSDCWNSPSRIAYAAPEDNAIENPPNEAYRLITRQIISSRCWSISSTSARNDSSNRLWFRRSYQSRCIGASVRSVCAIAALQTLAELGYARTSLREIAQNTEFSHGVLHYYFSDKEDLITHCVRQYEAACVTRYDEIVASASSAGELKREFSAAMAQTLRTDAPMHRLWYDLRNQSLFEESFRADVLEIDQHREEMIWRVISRYASFGGFSIALSPGAAYAILDGLFQQALLHHLAGDEDAARDLAANVVRVLDGLEVRDSR